MTLLLGVTWDSYDYDTPMLISVRDVVGAAAGVSQDAVTISASAGLGNDETARRLAVAYGSTETASAVVLTLTIQPSLNVTGSIIVDNLARRPDSGGLGETLDQATATFASRWATRTFGITVLWDHHYSGTRLFR